MSSSFVAVITFLENDEYLHIFPSFRIRNSDGTRFLHLGVLVKYLINIPWVDIEAAGDNHVLLPVHDVKVSVLIHRSDIPRI